MHPYSLEQPSVSVGLSSKLGLAVTILGAIGALVAAVQGADTATITAAATGLLAALGTISSRTAQAVQITRSAALAAGPTIDAFQAALEDPEVDEVPADELPTDEEELAGPPPENLG